MQFRVLGPLELAAGDQATGLPSARRRRLLAALLAEAGRVVAPERLIDAVWGSDPPTSAHGSLHSHLARLRAILRQLAGEPERIVTRGGGYVLTLADGDEIDAAAFDDEISRARVLLGDDARSALELVERALARWRGPPYADAAEAAGAEVQRLQSLHRGARQLRADALLALGEHDTAVVELEGRMAHDPLDEHLAGQLMLALFRCGRQAEAVAAFHAFRSRLGEELGVDPSPWLLERYEALLRQEAEFASPPRQPGALDPSESAHQPVDQRGAHRAPPEPAGEAPTAAGTATTRELTAAPAGRTLTSFVGRDAAVAGVAELLQRQALVTLTGPGGVGKTRLARAVAERVAHRYDDVAMVELAAVRQPSAVATVLAGELGVVPGGAASVRDNLIGALRGRDLLLVVDNCEHLLPEAAELIEHLVRWSPPLTVLATSRVPLAAEGEHRWPVPPLDAPPPDRGAALEAVADSPAVRLFCDRARAADPAFALTQGNAAAVSEICARLDGVPLALELAAARVAAFPVADLAARLDHRFALLTTGPRHEAGRHRTLREVVDWSYGLLEAGQARLFDRLSVFAGGFTRQAAEEVGGFDAATPGSATGQLASLIDQSMVVRVGDRYGLLETLRVYGLERLTERGEADRLRESHARYYATRAERAGRAIRGPEEGEWVAWLADELDNLRAAHRWAVEAGDADVALRLSAPLAYYADWWLVDEIATWAEQAIAVAGADGHELLPMAYGLAARGAGNRGELDRSAALARQGLAAAPDPGDPRRLTALKALSLEAFYGGQLEESARLEDRILDLAETAEDGYNAAYAWVMRALIATYRGKADAARTAAEQACVRADALGNVHLRAMARYCRGEALAERDPEAALGWVDEGVGLARQVGARLPAAVALVTRSSLHGAFRDPPAALRSFREAITYLRRGGDWTHQWTALRNLVFLLARLASDEAAVGLIGASETTATGAQVYGTDAERLRTTTQQLRDRLGEARFAAAHQRGQRMSDAEAVEVALATIDRLLATPDG